MDDPTMETLARRLDRVEQENRPLNRAGVMALAVMMAVVLMGQATANAAPKAEQSVWSIAQDPRFIVGIVIAAVVPFLTSFFGVVLSFKKERRRKGADDRRYFAHTIQSMLNESANNLGILTTIMNRAGSGGAFPIEIHADALRAALSNPFFYRYATHSTIMAAAIVRIQLSTINNILFDRRLANILGRGMEMGDVERLRIRLEAGVGVIHVMQERLDETMREFGAAIVVDNQANEVNQRLAEIMRREREMLERA